MFPNQQQSVHSKEIFEEVKQSNTNNKKKEHVNQQAQIHLLLSLLFAFTVVIY
jgi:hypothetical protein